MSDDESSIDGSLEDFLVREGIRGFSQPMGSASKQRAVVAGVGSGAAGDMSFESHSSIEDRDGDASFSSYGDGDIITDNLDVMDLLLPSVEKIGHLLRGSGHKPVAITKHDIDGAKRMSVYVIDAWAQSVLACLMEMKERIDTHSSTLHSTSAQQRKNAVSTEALENRVRELQEQLHDSERKVKSSDLKLQRLEEEQAGGAKQSKSSSTETKRMLRNLEDKLAESERRVRVRDQDLEKLKAKLLRVAEKEKDTSRRHREALRGGAGVDTSFTSQSSASSSKNTSFTSMSGKKGGVSSPPGDVVEALEAQRDGLEQRNAELDAQVSELSGALRDALNGRGSPGRAPPQRAPDGSVSSVDGEEEQLDALERTATAQAMYDKIREQNRQIDKLAHRCEAHKATDLQHADTVAQLKTRNDELREALENLRLEMMARPSPKVWAEKQKELRDAEDKLHDLVMMRGEAAELAAWKKHMSVTDRIKVDKRNHELGLWVLDSLPKAVTKEVLQCVCRELDVSDVSEVQPTLAKLKAVVKAVPRMERFIAQICSFLFERDRKIKELDGRGFGGRERPSMEDVLPVLQNWWGEVQQLDALAEFQDKVLAELHRREQLLSKQTLSTNDGDFGPGLRFRWSQREVTKAYDIIRGCVDFEAEVLKHKKSFGAAEDFLRQQPDLLVNRQISHIQYLFNIPSIEGIYPRMNQVYLFHEQMSNFLNTCRQALALKGAPDASVISELQRMMLELSSANKRSDVEE